MAGRAAPADSQLPSIPPVASGPALGDDSELSSFMRQSESADTTQQEVRSGSDEQIKNRSLLGVGKKATNNAPGVQDTDEVSTITSAPRFPPIAPLRPISPLRSTERLMASSPKRSIHPYGGASSPPLSSLSPRPHSPASSQIFERNVQEEVLPAQASPQIPSHIITENHIPPVLEEASAAITDKKLDPDTVEIVTHTMHQPAGLTVASPSVGEQSLASSVMEEPSMHRDLDESRANMASMDSVDVRRLSFVSFADVVHAEQAAESSDLANVAASRRSTSPLRSPTSSHGLGTSPPTSVSPPFKPFDSSPGPAGRVTTSPPPNPQSPPLDGDLNVETMRQALRRTGSGDLSSARSGILGSPALEE